MSDPISIHQSLASLFESIALPSFDADRSETVDGLDNPEVTNGDRADWAGPSLESFQTATRQIDDPDSFPDLVCALLHLAHFQGVDPLAAAATGISNFLAETLPIPDEP